MISIELICESPKRIWIVRGGADHVSYKNKDPFEFVCTVLEISESKIEIKGLLGKFSWEAKNQITMAFENLGFSEHFRERSK